MGYIPPGTAIAAPALPWIGTDISDARAGAVSGGLMSRISRSVKTLTILGAAAVFTAMTGEQALAQGAPFLSTADTAIGIDTNAVFGPNGRYPATEGPMKAIDNVVGSKYLNFGGAGAGFIITPAALAAVESFQIRTGNDAPGRDPSSWQLFGFNGTLLTTDSGPDPAINAEGNE